MRNVGRKEVDAFVKIVREFSTEEIFPIRTYSLPIRSLRGLQNWNYSSLFEGVVCDLKRLIRYRIVFVEKSKNRKAHLQYLRDKYILEKTWKVLPLAFHLKLSTLLYHTKVVDKKYR